jgi:hypothetical protein
MKYGNLIIFCIVAGMTYDSYATTNQIGTLTNNGSVPVNVIMYNNYTAPTKTRSARGRLNSQGMIIPPGQNINFIPNTTSIDVYYGNGNIPGIHADVQNFSSYTISPGQQLNESWVVTQDF